MKSYKGARNSLQGDTFEVGIALLTAASSSVRQCADLKIANHENLDPQKFSVIIHYGL